MSENSLLQNANYDPNNLLDSLLEKLGLRNDAALSRVLEVAPTITSKIRHRRLPVGASLLIRMHEVSGLSIKDLRILMGDRREKLRAGQAQFMPNEPDNAEHSDQTYLIRPSHDAPSAPGARANAIVQNSPASNFMVRRAPEIRRAATYNDLPFMTEEGLVLIDRRELGDRRALPH